MSNAETENDFTVTIEGSDYKFSDLTDDNKVLVNHIRDLDAQVEQLNFRFEQLNASKNFFSDKLVWSLNQAKKQSDSNAESEEESSESEQVESEIVETTEEKVKS
jgi:seryl-tRNA synthetase